MGSTFVKYNGRGFEAGDSTLEVWLHLLIDEIDKLDHPPLWLQEVREEWQLQSTAGFGYGVVPGLDHFVTDNKRRDVLLGLSNQALSRLEQYGELITKKELNAMQTGEEGAIFLEDVPSEAFKRVGRYFIKLLKGELEVTDKDSRI